MSKLTKTVGSALFSLLFAGSVVLAAHYIPMITEEPKTSQLKLIPQAEFIGPNYCTPGIEADQYQIKKEDSIYRLIVKYDLEMEDIKKYNSKLKDFTSIITGGTLCLPLETIEDYLKL
jgi:hypothetical protein